MKTTKQMRVENHAAALAQRAAGGFPKIAECWQVTANDWPLSAVEVLAMAKTTATGHNMTLVKISSGYEIAGSAMRWTMGGYGVRCIIDGTTHGRRYSTRQAAAAEFERCTGQPADPLNS